MLNGLGIDYIDLVLIHWPGVAKMKNDNAKIKDIRLGIYIIIETWEAMIEF